MDYIENVMPTQLYIDLFIGHTIIGDFIFIGNHQTVDPEIVNFRPSTAVVDKGYSI